VGEPEERTGDLRLAAALFAALAVVALVRLVRRPDTLPPLEAWAPAHRIDVNRAPAGELMALPGVGRVLAERIVAGRSAGPYRWLDDLARVRGIGPTLLSRVAPHVRFDPRRE